MNDLLTKDDKNNQQRNRSRWMLIGIAVIFALPVVGPFFWTPKSFVNHGELIQPQARPLEALKLVDSQNMPIGIESFQGKWTMLIIDDASCGEVCQKNLYHIRQVRLTQGRRMKRVQLAWILLSGSKQDVASEIQQEYSQVAIYNIHSGRQIEFNDLFSTQFGKPEDKIQRVYFIDPFGNLVMSFGPDQDPKDIQKDIGRLLKVSKAGEDQT